MDLDQAINTADGAYLRINRAKLVVIVAKQAIEAALQALGIERA